MSINEIRDTLASLEEMFALAMDAEQFETATQVQKKHNALWERLMALLETEDRFDEQSA